MTLALGLFAAALTTASFVAQTAKILRTRDTSSLSLPMWILSVAAFVVWIVYGVVRDELPIIIPNVLCCGLAAFILVLKVRPRVGR